MNKSRRSTLVPGSSEVSIKRNYSTVLPPNLASNSDISVRWHMVVCQMEARKMDWNVHGLASHPLLPDLPTSGRGFLLLLRNIRHTYIISMLARSLDYSVAQHCPCSMMSLCHLRLRCFARRYEQWALAATYSASTIWYLNDMIWPGSWFLLLESEVASKSMFEAWI